MIWPFKRENSAINKLAEAEAEIARLRYALSEIFVYVAPQQSGTARKVARMVNATVGNRLAAGWMKKP